jgi:hypothetical protein
MVIKIKEMEKKGFNGKNEEPFIPEGLEYREEHWQKALEGIIRDEKRKDRRKLAWIFSAVALLLLVGTYAVATYFISPDQSGVISQQNVSGISANPETKSLSTQDIPKETEDNNITSFNSLPNQSTGIPHETTTHQPIGNPDGTIRQANNKPNDRSVMGRDFAELETQRLPLPVKDNKGFQVLNLSIDPEQDKIELNYSDLTQDMLPSSNITESGDWDRQYRITPITKLQLPSDAEVLRTPYTLKSDRNWTEPTWRLWAFVGSSLVTDFSSPLRDIRIDPMAGLRLEYNFSKRLFVDGGLEYFGISNVRRPYSQTSIAYDLNYQRTITTVETHKLHYLSMPLHIGYRITRKHQITLGCGISYMITGVNEIFQYKQTPTSNTLINHYDDSGFVAGFKDFPIHSEIGYSYKLGRNKSIRLAYQFGLTDISKNAYFNSTSFDRNSRFVVDLSIKLKSK